MHGGVVVGTDGGRELEGVGEGQGAGHGKDTGTGDDVGKAVQMRRPYTHTQTEMDDHLPPQLP